MSIPAIVAGTLTKVAPSPEEAISGSIGMGKAILRFFKFGIGDANPLQVPAARAQQIFELAGNNLYAVAKAGLITPQTAVIGMDALIQSGKAFFLEQGKSIGNPAQAASIGMEKTIRAEQVATQNLPVPVALLPAPNLVEARKVYTPANTPGWYADSITRAAAVTDEYLKLVPSAIPAEVTVAGITLPPSLVATVKSVWNTSYGKIGIVAIPVLVLGYALLRKSA